MHFPPSVYQKFGASQMLPKLLEKLDVEVLHCVQFLRGGKVRVSFQEKALRDEFLSEAFVFGDIAIPVTRHEEKITTLHVRDLPYEVDSEDVLAFFETYGDVSSVERSSFADSQLFNGNLIVKLVLNQDLPYFMTVCGCDCRVWYREQPPQCFVCRKFGHRAQSCPLSGLCRRCHRPGHKARECTQAWDSVPSVPIEVDVPSDSPVPVDVSKSAVPIEADAVLPSDSPVPNPVPIEVDAVSAPKPADNVVPNVSSNACISDSAPVIPVTPADPVTAPAPPTASSNACISDSAPVTPVTAPAPPTVTSGPSGSSGPSTGSKTRRSAVDMFITVPKENASDPAYKKAFQAIYEHFRTKSRTKFVKLTTSDLNKLIADILWRNDCRLDCPDLTQSLLTCLVRLQKHLRANSK